MQVVAVREIVMEESAESDHHSDPTTDRKSVDLHPGMRVYDERCGGALRALERVGTV